MGEINYTMEQLMELAGLSVAQATYDIIANNIPDTKRILTICGPGSI